jgi:hypothetical protein
MNKSRLGIAVFAAGIVFASFAAAADSPRVGVTGAVNPSAAGAPPGADARQLTVGSDIQFRERVITTTDGQAQILFLDQSSLLIGPNSTVVIDEFVYDPATNKGNIAATLTQGSFRYIGGKLSKQGNATLKTPVATLGIRGSDITINYEAAKSLMNVIATHGIASIRPLSGGPIGLRSGFGATVDGLNKTNGTPTALTAQQIAAANGKFEGQPGKNAGAGKPPTDGDVAKSGLGGAVEAQGLASIAPAAGGPVAGGIAFNVPFTPGNNDTPPIVSPPPTPVIVPAARTQLGLNGYVAGFGFRSSESTSFSDMLTNDAPTDITIQTRPDTVGNGRVFAVFNFRGVDAESLSSASVQIGDPLNGNSAIAVQSIFINDATFLASQNAPVSGAKGQVNGNDAAIAALLVSLPALGLSGLSGVPGSEICTCEYVTWGMWTADLAAQTGRDLSVPIGLWVAGKLPEVTDPSPQGSAVFSGTALGIVHNQAQQYFATGAFTNNYNFTQRTGTVSISNFDGKTFGGTVNAGADWRSYGGALAGSGLAGNVNGSFYGNRTAAGQLQMPKETAGNFNVGNSGYAASGIFIGKR